MKLFTYESYQIQISPEAMALKPFKDIWDRDKSKNKNRALQELSFVYFYCDPKSDYVYISNETERAAAIIKDEGMGNWIPDNKVIKAVDFYNSFKTTTILLLESSRKAAQKVRDFLERVDLMETDDKGRPKYVPSQIISAEKEVLNLIEVFDKVEKKALQEQTEINRMRGGGEKTIFEEDLNI